MKKRLLLLLSILITMVASGCWSEDEPKTLAIINSIIYDIKDEGQYRVTAEIMNPAGATGAQQNGASQESPTITIVGEGDSLREALANLSQSIEKSIFGAHNKARFFTEHIARQGMLPFLDFFAREHLTDETPLMIVLKDELPENIYFSVMGLSDMAGDYFDDLSKHQLEQTSKSVFITALDFIKDYYTEGKQPVMGVAELVEQKPKPPSGGQNPQGSQNGQSNQGSGENGDDSSKQLILYEGLAAFKDDKLAGYMDGIEARAYNMITGKFQTSYITIPSGEGQTVLKINGSSADIQTQVEGGQVSVLVNIKVDLDVVETSGGLDVSKIDPLKTIQDGFNRKMQGEAKAAVSKAQHEFQSDIFGFGQYVHSQHPDKWRELKNSWDDHFAKAAVEITVESSVTRSGEIKEPFDMGD